LIAQIELNNDSVLLKFLPIFKFLLL